MSDRQWIALGVRISAIFFFIIAMGYAARTLPYLFQEDVRELVSEWLLLSYGIITFLFILFSIVLWKFPMTIAGRLVPGRDNEDPITGASIEHVQATVLTTVGIIILAVRLPDIIYWSVYLYSMSKVDNPPQFVDPDVIAPFVTTFFEILLGLWLALRARGIIGFVKYLRVAGVEK